MDMQGALSSEPEADAEGERSAMGERVLEGDGEEACTHAELVSLVRCNGLMRLRLRLDGPA
jgi:hypothetical protein